MGETNESALSNLAVCKEEDGRISFNRKEGPLLRFDV